jgi:hypothetical protein
MSGSHPKEKAENKCPRGVPGVNDLHHSDPVEGKLAVAGLALSTAKMRKE